MTDALGPGGKPHAQTGLRPWSKPSARYNDSASDVACSSIEKTSRWVNQSTASLGR